MLPGKVEGGHLPVHGDGKVPGEIEDKVRDTPVQIGPVRFSRLRRQLFHTKRIVVATNFVKTILLTTYAEGNSVIQTGSRISAADGISEVQSFHSTSTDMRYRTPMALRTAVVGAGIVGLATASELARAGAEVRLYEKGAIAGAQSKGTTRIFRCAHADPEMVALALRARKAWRAWEDRFRRRLIGDEGLILTGEEIVQTWALAMQTAGAAHREITSKESRERLPISNLPAVPTLFDPAGGATRVRRTVDLLSAEIAHCIVHAEVEGLDSGDAGCTVHSSDGPWPCDAVVIAAGIETGSIARSVGLELPVQPKLHSRFTFEIRGEFRDATQSCWIDDSGVVGDRWYSYCQPVGTTGRYAVGVSWDNQRCTPDVGEETVSRESLGVARAYIAEVLPGLHPDPVDEIRCTYGECLFQDDAGDGFGTLQKDRITAFYGNNLFKFAPLLGELLAQTALNAGLTDGLVTVGALR